MNKFLRFFERPFEKGKMIKNYRILDVLGAGSYGFSYLVEDSNDKTVKVLKQERKRIGNDGKKSFETEKNILKQIQHSAIPKYINHFVLGEKHYILMEYKKGKTVEDLIFSEGKIFHEQETFFILQRILEIVKVIHENRIIHRDLRTPNILINDEQIYIIDFGLAKRLDDCVNLEKSNEPLEKRLFRECSFRSDFYALGHFVLFLLYSHYKPKDRKERPWEEELTLTPDAKVIIRKLLQLEQPYEQVHTLIKDIQKLLIGRNENVVF
jgi:serine/threonine protein kinase, bacterial